MLTVFAGPMFSGKTTALIEQSRKLGIDHIWKPRKDTRDESIIVRSHDGLEVQASVLDTKQQIQHLYSILVDEFQFLPKSLATDIINYSNHADVYVSMLDKDYRGINFENYDLILNSEVTKRMEHRFSRCTVCDGKAMFSFRKVKSDDLIFCGAGESYEPRCLDHFSVLQL